MQFLLSKTWCCLSPVEQGFLLQLLFLFRFGASYITRDDFNLYWAVYDPDYSIPRRDLIVPTYFLVPGVVEIEPDVWIDVYYFSTGFWVALSVFGDGGGFDCDTPCYIRAPGDFS